MNMRGSGQATARKANRVTATAGSDDPAAPLISVKFTMPTGPHDAIVRLRLHAALDAAAQAKLALIVAPAGFGKTVAVTQWLSASPARTVAWLSLDQHDNDPARFWTYALAALAAAGPAASPGPTGSSS